MKSSANLKKSSASVSVFLYTDISFSEKKTYISSPFFQ